MGSERKILGSITRADGHFMDASGEHRWIYIDRYGDSLVAITVIYGCNSL